MTSSTSWAIDSKPFLPTVSTGNVTANTAHTPVHAAYVDSANLTSRRVRTCATNGVMSRPTLDAADATPIADERRAAGYISAQSRITVWNAPVDSPRPAKKRNV